MAEAINSTLETVYSALYSDEEARVCKDVPESACRHQPRNWIVSTLSLALTKTGDAIVDPKLTLTWLFGALGAPAFLIGLIAPIREAGALLPQLFVSASIRRQPKRKHIWSIGSAGQGAALLLMAVTALTAGGAMAGWLLLLLLAAFAFSRSLCSVSHKDVMGKTVSKTRRGAVGGYATTLSGLVALLFGGLLVMSPETNTSFIAGLLVAGAGLWMAAAFLYTRIQEDAGATQGGGNAFPQAAKQISLLWTDSDFGRFVTARSLLISTSIAPPFVVALAQRETGTDLVGLGGFIIASAAAGFLSGWAWGRLADKSSRYVLASGGLIGALACLVSGVSLIIETDWTVSISFHAATVFLLAFGHQGVRLGRSTYLVDLGTPETRASYTAVSNTVIGIMLLLFGLLMGGLFQFSGPWVLIALAASAVSGAVLTLTLRPVSG